MKVIVRENRKRVAEFESKDELINWIKRFWDSKPESRQVHMSINITDV